MLKINRQKLFKAASMDTLTGLCWNLVEELGVLLGYLLLRVWRHLEVMKE